MNVSGTVKNVIREIQAHTLQRISDLKSFERIECTDLVRSPVFTAKTIWDRSHEMMRYITPISRLCVPVC